MITFAVENWQVHERPNDKLCAKVETGAYSIVLTGEVDMEPLGGAVESVTLSHPVGRGGEL